MYNKCTVLFCCYCCVDFAIYLSLTRRRLGHSFIYIYISVYRAAFDQNFETSIIAGQKSTQWT